MPAQSDNINKYGIDLSILNEEDWFYAELYSGHVKWLNRGKMFDRDDRESISYQCEENKIYKEGRLCRKDDIRVLRKATPSDLAPFFEKHPEYEPVNKKYNVLHKTSEGMREMNYQDTTHLNGLRCRNYRYSLYWFYAVLWAAVIFKI